MAGRVIIGIDCDSSRHGVAIYRGGVLDELHMMNTVELIRYLAPIEPPIGGTMLVSIEDVMANQFVYTRNQKQNKAAQSKVAMHIGRCQQAQVELMRWLDSYGIEYALHSPQLGNWSDKRELFERLTGWTKQSNADTRAAAYFGYLEVKKCQQ
jgi:hypothetical protein